MQSSAILIHRHGGPEVLESVRVDVLAPGRGEVQIRQTAIGLNFADIYQRKGAHGPHASAPFPIVLGAQGAGVVEAVGDASTTFTPGSPSPISSPAPIRRSATCRLRG